MITKDLQIDGVEILENEPLSKHTSFGIGGKGVLLLVKTLEALSYAIKYLNENNLPYMIIGDGTNLLVSDNDLDTIFIKLGGDFKKITYNGNIITSGAGVKLSDLCRDTLNNNFQGLEKIGTIPGTVGGACIMNAGVRLFDFSTNLVSVGVVDRFGEYKVLPKEKCGYSYRESIFQYTKDYVIVNATIKLEKTVDTTPLWDVLNASVEKRKATQPKGKCAGCFFKNTDNESSGKIIEECGLKGMRVGGAFVAQEHANFIMNDGNATCEDVLSLANKIKETVKKEKNKDLVFEVRIVD